MADDGASTVGLTEHSAMQAWGLDAEMPEDVHRDSFAKHMREAVGKMLKEFGGPENYLRVRFQDPSQLNEWLNYLVHLVPLDCAEFSFSDNIPTTLADDIEKDRGLGVWRLYQDMHSMSHRLVVAASFLHLQTWSCHGHSCLRSIARAPAEHNESWRQRDSQWGHEFMAWICVRQTFSTVF